MMERLRLVSLSEAIGSAEHVPVGIDPDRRQIIFAPINREDLRSAAFVTEESGRGKQPFCANIDDILLYYESSRESAKPLRFIFITAFCCSTLLARYLGQCPGCVAVREPSILGQLALLNIGGRSGGPRGRRWGDADWQEWLRLALDLFARGADKDRAVIIKLADPSNAIIADIQRAADSSAQSVLLYVGLRTFILTVLKSEARREWMRERVRLWRPFVRDLAPLALLRPSAMNDADGAAYLWCITAYLWRQALSDWGSGRLRAMNGELVASDPAAAVEAANECFKLGLGEDEIRAAAWEGGTRDRHSKGGGGYTAAQRADDLRRWEGRFGLAADEAVARLARVVPQLEGMMQWMA